MHVSEEQNLETLSVGFLEQNSVLTESSMVN